MQRLYTILFFVLLPLAGCSKVYQMGMVKYKSLEQDSDSLPGQSPAKEPSNKNTSLVSATPSTGGGKQTNLISIIPSTGGDFGSRCRHQCECGYSYEGPGEQVINSRLAHNCNKGNCENCLEQYKCTCSPSKKNKKYKKYKKNKENKEKRYCSQCCGCGKSNSKRKKCDVDHDDVLYLL